MGIFNNTKQINQLLKQHITDFNMLFIILLLELSVVSSILICLWPLIWKAKKETQKTTSLKLNIEPV